MNQTLDAVVRTLEAAEARVDVGLRRIRRPVETYVLPPALGTALSLEALNLARELDILIVNSQGHLRELFGRLGYQVIEDLGTLSALVGGIGFVALPAAVSLYRYYRRTQQGVFAKDDAVLGTILDNGLVTNRVVLPALAAVGSVDLAYNAGITNYGSPLDIAKGLLIVYAGLVSARDLHRYFRGDVSTTPAFNRWRNKIPGLYLLAAAAIVAGARSTIERHLGEDTKLLERTLADRPEDEKKIVGYRTAGTLVTTYSRTIKYYSELYGQDWQFVEAIARAESGVNHFRRRNGRIEVVESESDAFGIGQLTKIAVRQINDEIRAGNLYGVEPFDWDEVVNNPAENIRASVATIKYLRNLCKEQENEERCLELIAAGYIAGLPRINNALKSSGEDTLWEAAGDLDLSQRHLEDVMSYVRKVMAFYWTMKNDVDWPTESERVTSGFYERRRMQNGRYRLHGGIDIGPITAGVAGDPIYAFADGVVVTAGYGGREGYYVKLRHGIRQWGLYTLYIHGKRGGIKVSEGDKVYRGDVLMDMGGTGNARGAVHLHFAVRNEFSVGGRRLTVPINPTDFYRRFGTDELVLDVREPIYAD